MTYIQEEKWCEPSLLKTIVTTCYEILLRPIHNKTLDNFVYRYTGYDRTLTIKENTYDTNGTNDTNKTNISCTQEDEESFYTFDNESSYYNDHYNDRIQHTSSSNKRKYIQEPLPYSKKMQRPSTYSKFTDSLLKPPNVERRRCASVPSSYTEINKYSKENIPIIQCQYCEKLLCNDVVYVGADMTFCSSHCRRNTFHSYKL